MFGYSGTAKVHEVDFIFICRIYSQNFVEWFFTPVLEPELVPCKVSERHYLATLTAVEVMPFPACHVAKMMVKPVAVFVMSGVTPFIC